MILNQAKAETAAAEQQALAELDERSRKLDRESSELQSARTAFEHEKRVLVRETVSRLASLRRWRAAGLSEVAHLNGRMYRLSD